MEGRDVARFARELRERIEERGAAALDSFDWAGRFRGLGFRMDCGHSYEERYGIALRDVRGLRRELSRIDDVQALGDACFSQCRYITHWAMVPCDDLVEWLGVALARLEELAGGVELAWDDEAGGLRTTLDGQRTAVAAPRGGGGQNSSRIELRTDGRCGNGFVSGRSGRTR